MVLNNIAVSAEWLISSFQNSGAVGRFSVLAAVCALAVAAVVVIFRTVTVVIVYVTAVIVVAAQLVFLWSTSDPSSLPHTWWAWQLMICVSVLICGVLPTRQAVPALAVALVCYAYARLSPASGPGHGFEAALSDLTSFAIFAALVWLLVPAWRRTAAVTDSATRARNRAHAVIEAARAADRQRRAAARLLHDEVIHALRAVALPPGAIDPALVRTLADQASELLVKGSSAAAAADRRVAGLPEALADALTRSPLDVRLQCPTEPALPESVVTAIAGVVAEALRNVERHSGVNEASVIVRSIPGGAQVTVIDQGRGFNPDRMSGLRMGCRNSILDRIAEVGGRATIASAPGAGTTVTIAWFLRTPEDVDRDSSQRLADLAGTRTKLMIGAVLPIVVLNLINSALHHDLMPDPGAALVAVGATTAVIAATFIWTRSRPIPAWMSICLVATTVAVVVIGGWNLRSGPTVEVEYFAAGAGAPALCFVAYFRPRWESIVGVIASTAAAAWMVDRMDPGWDSMRQSLPAVMSNLIAVVCVLVTRHMVDRASRNVLWDEEMERQAESVRVQLTIGRQVVADRLGRVQAWVLPFLKGIADGSLSPVDRAVRQEAAVREAAVRDDLRLGTSLSDRARNLIADARLMGQAVEINADPEATGTLSGGLISELITFALADRTPPDRTVLTVSSPSLRQTTVSLLVSPPPQDDQLLKFAAGLGASNVAGPDFLLIRAVVPDGGVSSQVGTTRDLPDRVSSTG